MQHTRIFACLTLALLLLSACNLPGGPAGTPVDVNAIYTAAAQTLAAQQTQSASAQPTTPPTDTPVPPTPTSAESPTPEFTATATVPPATPTPSVPMVLVDTNSNCRLGPSTAYNPPLAVLKEGQRAEIHGRNPDRSWWYVQIPDRPGQYCWVWGNNVGVEGDTSNVQVVTPPPVPITATFTPAPEVKFDHSFDNIHECNGDPYVVFEVDNVGDVDIESMRLQIEDLDEDEEIFDDSDDAPFLSGSGQCPGGGDQFEVDDTVWVAGNIEDGGDGNDGLATITMCSKEDLDGICETEEVEFTIDLSP